MSSIYPTPTVARVRLYELAYCCDLFPKLDNFDRATIELRERTGPHVDPANEAHHEPLFEWLRKWRCRQFVIRDEAIASEGLSRWWADWESRLPSADKTLDQLTDEELAVIAQAYEALRETQASWQELDSAKIPKRFGPAGAAKTMYAIRPRACSPWDDPIREQFKLGESGEEYRRHLDRVRKELSEVVEELEPDMDAASLPDLLGRPDSSPVKLVDEHDWVRYSRGFEPPTPETLKRWAQWVDDSTDAE